MKYLYLSLTSYIISVFAFALVIERLGFENLWIGIMFAISFGAYDWSKSKLLKEEYERNKNKDS